MNVVKITPRGYCHGVVDAIKLINNLIQDENTPRPIYILGMIVHNKDIINAFSEYGVITIDNNDKTRFELLDEINSGTVVFTAHGISDDAKTKAMQKGLNCVDASCNDVIKTQKVVDKHLDLGFDVIYIGKKGHPEPEAVVYGKQNIYLVETVSDVEQLEIKNENIFVTNQTTMSLTDIYHLTKAIMIKYPNAKFVDEICNATRIRQEAVINNDAADLCVVVGDPKSNNSRKLSEVSKVNSVRIANIHELDLELLKDINTVSITSGASTPTSVTNQVIQFLELFDYNNKDTWKKPDKLTAAKILSFLK